jgi:hypothetical protein
MTVKSNMMHVDGMRLHEIANDVKVAFINSGEKACATVIIGRSCIAECDFDEPFDGAKLAPGGGGKERGPTGEVSGFNVGPFAD